MGDVLLVAGPTGLDREPDAGDLLAGSGYYAAAAAGPLTPVQLWARGGDALTAAHHRVLERRRVDPAGVGDEGATARYAGAAVAPDDADGPVLPELEPVDASDLGAVLLIDLPDRELDRALAVVRALPEAERRPLLVAPRPGTGGDRLLALAEGCSLMLTAVSEVTAALEEADPVRCAQRLIDAGAVGALLSAGPLGGVAAYKQKLVTWPAGPRPASPQPGCARAVFAGVVAGEVAALGRIGFRNLNRAAATAGAVACEAARKRSPKHLMGLKAADYHQLFLRLRRKVKF